MTISSGSYTFGTGGNYSTFGAAWNDIATSLTGNMTLTCVGDSIQPTVQIGASVNRLLNGHTLTITSDLDPAGNPNGGHLITAKNFSMNGISNGLVVFDKLNIITESGVAFNSTFAPYVGSGNGQSVRNCILRATAGRALIMGNVTDAFTGGATATYSLFNTKIKGTTGAFRFLNGTLGNEPSMRFISENVIAQATDAGANPFDVQTRLNDSLLQFSMRNVIGWVNPSGGTAKPINLTGMNSTIKADYGALIVSSAANGGNLDSIAYPYPAITSPSDIISLSEADQYWLSTSGSSDLYSNGTSTILAGNPYNSSPYPIGIPGPAPVLTPSPATPNSVSLSIVQGSVICSGSANASIESTALAIIQKSAEAINLTAPILLSPKTGSINRIGVPLLLWSHVPHAEFYEVHISENADFLTRSMRYDVSLEELFVGFPPGVTLFWKVRAIGFGGYSLFSETWQFSTMDFVPKRIPSHNVDGRGRILWQFKENAGA